MPRRVSPPVNELDSLPHPLTSGERRVFDFFNARLAPEWEIYVQPHLNGLRPDFVLLHPRIGVAVFEVKDWSLNDAAYQVQKREDGTPVLMVNDHGEWRAIEQANPVEKILHYKQEIFDLYCPRLDQRAGRAVMTAGLIFPSTGDRRVREFFEPWLRRHREIVQYPGRHPVTGMEAIDGGRIDQVFPEHNRGLSKIMNETLARDLRSWLVEPDFALAQREPLDMDKNQNNLVTSRTDTGYRRIKGPAGSGKSLVLAARAVELANEGKDVLVVNYTITLPHYLRDLAARCHRNGEGRGSITWLNFHAWCKRVCIQAGFKKEYDNLFAEIRSAERREPDKKNNGLKEIMDHRIPDLVDRIISRNLGHPDTIYDAVLLDEAQDFQLKWWNLLRKVCRQGGEKLLVADATQDIYGTARVWTEEAMHGAGFRGDWVRLATSYRLPPKAVQYAREFASRFLDPDLIDLPEKAQGELDIYPCNLKWVQTDSARAEAACLREILAMAPAADPELLAMTDITFLAPSQKSGMAVVAHLKGQYNIACVDTFDDDSQACRRKKMGFFMGDARVKATTLHSFKGWESRAMVVLINTADNHRALALVYTGLTRLKRHVRGSFLTVVSCAPELREYGASWPDFLEQ